MLLLLLGGGKNPPVFDTINAMNFFSSSSRLHFFKANLRSLSCACRDGSAVTLVLPHVRKIEIDEDDDDFVLGKFPLSFHEYSNVVNMTKCLVSVFRLF